MHVDLYLIQVLLICQLTIVPTGPRTAAPQTPTFSPQHSHKDGTMPSCSVPIRQGQAVLVSWTNGHGAGEGSMRGRMGVVGRRAGSGNMGSSRVWKGVNGLKGYAG